MPGQMTCTPTNPYTFNWAPPNHVFGRSDDTYSNKSSHLEPGPLTSHFADIVPSRIGSLAEFQDQRRVLQQILVLLTSLPPISHFRTDNTTPTLTDKELDTILPATGYVIVTPPPGYAPMVIPCKLMAMPVTEVGSFHIQESSDAAAMATAVGLIPELPTEFQELATLHFSIRRTLSILRKF
ncbi:hypothetical protein JVT61DRAFT_8367 [Boletus reticuloceps]|uniref:Splicing factor 3B subunit 1 domain-containing protein n=1 Tax=Boletus reticuloceps TaxID=495285 RepID=A0A8I3AFB2_9AGAM|nr:hypothetical protein JVT61DRAFT_8367 [Boletus reticuloceps]